MYTRTGFTRTLVVGSDEIERCRRCEQVAVRRGFKGNDVVGCTGALLGGTVRAPRLGVRGAVIK